MTSIDYYQLSEQLKKRLTEFFSNSKIAKAFLAIIIIFLGWNLYALGSLLFYYKNWQDIKPISLQADLNDAKSQYKSISLNHLFGATNKPGASLADALKSELSLALKGVISNVNPKLGSAIISDQEGNEETYNIGDKIPVPGHEVTLQYIFRDKIYIKNDQILEYIEYIKLEDKLREKAGQPSRFDGFSNGQKNKSANITPKATDQFLPKASDNQLKTPPRTNTPIPEGMDERRKKMFELRTKQLDKISRFKKRIQKIEKKL